MHVCYTLQWGWEHSSLGRAGKVSARRVLEFELRVRTGSKGTWASDLFFWLAWPAPEPKPLDVKGWKWVTVIQHLPITREVMGLKPSTTEKQNTIVNQWVLLHLQDVGLQVVCFALLPPIIFNCDCNYIHVFITVVEEQMMIQVKFSLLIQDAVKWVFT